MVSVMLAGKKLICANVGDSRAILGSYKSKQAHLLSSETIVPGKTVRIFHSYPY